jgi:hypothetical protein
MYDMIDGTYEPGRNQIHDKWEIIKYLNNLGYKFITYGGEEFPLVENLNGYNRVFQCGFEWLKAGQQFSQNWFGYEHGIWRKWDNRRNPVNSATYGQLAALSSYAVKFPYLITAYAPFTKPKFNLNNFSGIDFIKIRDTLNWIENVNYVKPLVVEHIGDTLDISMVANYTNNFNEYNLQGNSADYSVQDKPLFAFVESEVNQTLTVSLTHNDSVKKGIMLRDNLRENCNSIYFYCQNGKIGIERRTRGSSKISYPKLLFTPPISTSSILMVEHLGTEIKFYVSDDSKTNKLLLTISKSQLASGFLIGVANSNSTSTVGMTYKIKWGECF